MRQKTGANSIFATMAGDLGKSAIMHLLNLSKGRKANAPKSARTQSPKTLVAIVSEYLNLSLQNERSN